jgi:hypothetical protein
MAVTAHTPKFKPTKVDISSTATLPISNGTPCAASPERVAERMERWLLTQKKLDLGGAVGVSIMSSGESATYRFRCRRQGWTDQCEVTFWVANWGSAAPLTATAVVGSTTDPSAFTWTFAGTASKNASDAVKYTAVIGFGQGDRTDEQTLEDVTVTVTCGSGTAKVYIYGRSVRQLPFASDSMELAP